MSPAVKNVVLLVIIGVAIIAAGFFFIRGGSESDYADTEASITHWIDVETGEVWHLTAAELAKWRNDPEKRRRIKGNRQLVFFNPDTNDYTICGAMKDRKTGEWFCPMGPDGTEYPSPSEREEEPAEGE
ncbi:MAG: hypothetical protein KAY37_13660 [Phycisphaerae bacterium]|nr:hypothetical protein [Phycisphaerae bacterium]